MARRSSKATLMAESDVANYAKKSFVTIDQLEKAHKSGERVPLRVLLPGMDKKMWEYHQTIHYGRAPHIGFVPYVEHRKPNERGVQLIYTTPIDNVRLFNESKPLD